MVQLKLKFDSTKVISVIPAFGTEISVRLAFFYTKNLIIILLLLVLL